MCTRQILHNLKIYLDKLSRILLTLYIKTVSTQNICKLLKRQETPVGVTAAAAAEEISSAAENAAGRGASQRRTLMKEQRVAVEDAETPRWRRDKDRRGRALAASAAAVQRLQTRQHDDSKKARS